ncbi:MAG: hypothetical protein HYX90_12405 [Chloroflexi bacterium]|nr:hypothetical protein [Chloroflexota bacterium]
MSELATHSSGSRVGGNIGDGDYGSQAVGQVKLRGEHRPAASTVALQRPGPTTRRVCALLKLD